MVSKCSTDSCICCWEIMIISPMCKALFVYKALHGLIHYYMSNLLHPYAASRSLCSIDRMLLNVLRSRFKLGSGHAFTVFAPKLWNSIPLTDESVPSLSQSLFVLIGIWVSDLPIVTPPPIFSTFLSIQFFVLYKCIWIKLRCPYFMHQCKHIMRYHHRCWILNSCW